MRFLDGFIRKTRVYRAAEADLIRSAEARADAEDKADRLAARVSELVEERDAARAAEAAAARKVADWMALRAFGVPVFDASLTVPQTPQETIDARAMTVHGRDYVREQTRKFFEDCRGS